MKKISTFPKILKNQTIYQQKNHSVDVQGLEGVPVATAECPGIVVADEPHSLEDAAVQLPPTQVVDVDTQDQTRGDVQTGEEDPEDEVSLQNTDGAHQNDECLKEVKRYYCSCNTHTHTRLH